MLTYGCSTGLVTLDMSVLLAIERMLLGTTLRLSLDDPMVRETSRVMWCDCCDAAVLSIILYSLHDTIVWPGSSYPGGLPYLSTVLSIYLPIYLSTFLSTYLPTYLPTYLLTVSIYARSTSKGSRTCLLSNWDLSCRLWRYLAQIDLMLQLWCCDYDIDSIKMSWLLLVTMLILIPLLLLLLS